MTRVLPPLALLAATLALFGAWMHWAVLDPANIGWLLDGEDRGQAMIGLSAYLRAGGPWPSLHQPLLSAPEGMTILFTDSIPLLGLLLKPIAPAGLQWVGPWYLACLLLHAGFAWLLVRRHAADPVAAVAGALLLTLMPALLDRYGHASLCAQWLILWALWVCLERPRSIAWWAVVLGVAALVHSYLLLMVSAIWASALLRRLMMEPCRGRTLADTGVLLVPLALLWLEGAFGGPYLSTGTYGGFTLALDAWWNPANPAFTALMPSSPQGGGQAFEGLNYLGAGLLATVVAGAAVAIRDAATRRVLIPLAWLLPALAVLLVVATGPSLIWQGRELASVTLPSWLVDRLDPVRASGRLAWPATYTLSLAAVIAVARAQRGAVLLMAALTLQVVDLAPMMAAIRATSARADDPTRFHRTRDPRWEALIGRASSIDVQPANATRNLDVLEEMAYRAVLACRPVRYAYAARRSAITDRRLAADGAAFRAGRLDPARLYVILDGTIPAAIERRVVRIDGVALIPPTKASPAGCASSPRSGP